MVGRAWICQLYDLECFLDSHTLKWPVGVVFIATNQIVAVGEGCWRWAHRIVRCATGQCPMRRHVTLSLGLGAGWPLEALSSCGTGQFGATPDSPVPLWPSALTSAALLFIRQSRPLRVDSHCSAGVHRTVWWIIAELRLGNSKPRGLECTPPGAPDTVWWCTGQSGVPDQGTLRFSFASFFSTLTSSFYWFVLNLWHL
jgi:hypothetical protein